MIHCGDAYDLGVTGKGIGVAVLDTGIYPHEDFENRIAVFKDMIQHKSCPYDDNGHGTHISAIIGGAGCASERRYCGVAPGCHIISVKVLDRKGNGFASDVLAGLRWIRENRERYGIRIVNISVGSYSRKAMSEESVLVKGVNAAWDDGMVVVVAAGNQGPGRMTITTPGISRKVITVGCSDDHKEVNVAGSRMIDYSGRGPTGACICKPDLVAPGSSVISCSNEAGRYQIKSGTPILPVIRGRNKVLADEIIVYQKLSRRENVFDIAE